MHYYYYKRSRTDAIDDGEPLIFRFAEFILPKLTPAELTTFSITCKFLYRIVRSITSRRSSDAARSFERFPIPFVNSVDHRPYAYFTYTPTQTTLPPDDGVHQPWGSNPEAQPKPLPVPGSLVEGAKGCDCESCDGVEMVCPCYGMDGVLTRECGPSCGCELECGNRASQGGVAVRVKIVRSLKKGWGLHADQFIPCGQFVCEYAGELLTTNEARVRQQNYDYLSSNGQYFEGYHRRPSAHRFSSALLVVREHLPSRNACMRINIDATKVGNVARFINHSCDGGNLSTTLVRSSGALLPRVCFFASKDILQDEELTFSYGHTSLYSKGMKCFCGSSCCFGVLPAEHT